MPDAYENFNMAMLMNNIIPDNDAESYLAFNDLPLVSNTNILSPYSSSGSQGNMSASPMSTSSSPQHLTDYITLNDDTYRYEAVGEPYLEIIVQPAEKFRFRYKSEMMGTHGALVGIPHGNSRKKPAPAVKLNNFSDKAIIRCTLVTSDDECRNNDGCRISHAHRLVKREGTVDQDEPHYLEVSSQNNFTATFAGMGIIHTARKHIKDELVRKMRNEHLENCRRTNRNAIISIRDDAQIKANAENYQKSINLNSVALCFQAFIADDFNIMRPITSTVYSNPINNLKSALTGELKICRIDKYTSSCEGGEEVFIFVEKVGKKNIKIKFFELNDDDVEIWSDYGRFSELDVHHQYAIVFRTPPYKDQSITSPREVFIQLERPSDSDCSEPIKFTYKPSDRMIGRKRTRVSHSSSVELTQVAFNHNVNSTPDIHMNSNESEMSTEIKKMLDDRCSSSEFRDFVESIDIERYTNLLSNSEENKLTFDGPSRKQETDKLFARNVVIDALKRIKVEPDKEKQKDIIKNSFKDRSTYGDSPLHSALRYGQRNIAKYIFILMSTLPDHKDLVNIPNSSGKTALHYAVTQNQPDITKVLLLLGADPNLPDQCRQTPLHSAVKFQETRECVDILLSAKDINLEVYTDLGWTALHLAAEAGSYYAVQSLVKAGANVNNVDMSCGRTVLHIAVEGGHRDIIEFLLKNTNINVNKKNFGGNTALHNAVVTPGAKAKEICALLIKHGADPHIKNHNRESDQEEMVVTPIIKCEMDSEDENVEELSGQSSFDLASNDPDILSLVSGKHDVLLNIIDSIKKEEDIDETQQKIWLDAEQEKQLSAILDRTKGWNKLADYFNYKYLVKTFQQSSSSPTLLLLNYIAIQSETSLEQLRNILQNIGEEDASTYMSQILSKTFMKNTVRS
ncbi:nuclear factor NF-kappa-B p100 subunit isoform X2 [Odontomachus brunneus]|uniref:nuclear factor NF-kappa-B p100 subunit isoform X2 n=1 Tax=Odontomachus brunneus TaxID=486640 RepID=UPI0013F20BDD|nr:nuclear factor NF-kappa-B p100 subunit isoform X2 [Odontomachus brunneus]